jgi:hypothetical protein
VKTMSETTTALTGDEPSDTGWFERYKDASALAARLARDLAAANTRAEKLQAFKDYVHKRLDDAGVPADPDSPHKAEGCRIGGRLDRVFSDLAAARAELNMLKAGLGAVTTGPSGAIRTVKATNAPAALPPASTGTDVPPPEPVAAAGEVTDICPKCGHRPHNQHDCIRCTCDHQMGTVLATPAVDKAMRRYHAKLKEVAASPAPAAAPAPGAMADLLRAIDCHDACHNGTFRNCLKKQCVSARAAALAAAPPQPAAAATPEAGVSYAWVIERDESEPGRPQYWTGRSHPAVRWSDPGDHEMAIRLARKEDAERMAGYVDGSRKHRVAEHGWDAPPPAVPPASPAATASAETEGTEPTSWQCPKCHRWQSTAWSRCRSEYDTQIPCDGVRAAAPAPGSPEAGRGEGDTRP